jgi:monoterpene epsilon-lactone hydrolase
METGVEESLGQVLSLASAPDAIELRHLRAFVAVAEELNFGRAAARLYLSAPALSRQIRALERLVGCDLLRRSTHRVELTLAGDALLEHARKLLLDVDKAVTATRSVGGELMTRAVRFWEPIVNADTNLQDLRAAFEAMHAEFAPPPEISVRSVNTAGVAGLLLVPPSDPPPTVLYLHGGGHTMGSAYGYKALAGAVAAAAEGTVLVPEYRLAPEHPFPASLEDALRAYTWMLDQGVEPGRLTVGADSSGCHLALSLLLSLKQRELPLPGGAALLCPGVDLALSALEQRAPDEVMPELLAQMRFYAENFVAGHPMDDPLISPLTADFSGLPPMLIQSATGDFVAEDAHRLAEHARAHGVDVQLELYPADTHSFHIFWSFLPEAADALAQVGRFARATLAAATVAEPKSFKKIEETNRLLAGKGH